MTAIPMEATKKDSVGAESGNGHVTRERYNQARTAIKQYKSNTDMTWRELATAIGYSESSLGVFMAGQYESSHRIIASIEDYLALVEERRQLITQPVFVQTSIAKRIFALVKNCVLFTKIGICAAESGTGKTRSWEQLQLSYPRALAVRANICYAPMATESRGRRSSPWPTIEKLMEAVPLETAGYRYARTHGYDSLVASLRGTGRLIMIDQAQYLPSEAFHALMTIHEEANVPVVLFGHRVLYERGPSDRESLVAWQSRALRERLLTAQIKTNDVDLIAEQLVGVDVAHDAQKDLLEEARANGGFRRLVGLLQSAQTLRDGNRKVTRQHIVKAIEMRDADGGVA